MLRIADGFILREIAESWVVIPTGSNLVEFNGIISLSESGALLWRKLESGATEDDLFVLLADEYDISELDAHGDVKEFLSEMKAKGLII